MQETSRRTLLRLAAIAAVPLALPSTAGAARTTSTATITVTARSSLRLYVDCRATRGNGKLKILAYVQHPQTKRHNQLVNWGPFANSKGYTKTIYVDAGTYFFEASGGGVNFNARIETKTRDGENDYVPAGTLSGNWG